MTLSPDVKVTTSMLWEAALLFAILDIVFISLLARHIKPSSFRNFKRTLAVITGCFWCLLLATLMSWLFWEPVYHYVFPEWARWLVPPVYGLLFAAVGLYFWRLAVRLPGNPVVTWCVLGGLWGMITHLWAVWRGILDKPPMLQGVSPIAAVIMPIFEFIFYWCVILSIASLLQPMRRRS